MTKKDFSLVLLFSAMSVVFGLVWIVLLYFLKVGAFDESYKLSLFIGIVYAGIMLYYFKKSRTAFLFSHAMVMSMILNFFFSFCYAFAMYIMLSMNDNAFLSISIDVKISDMLLNKEEFLRTVSLENFNLSIAFLKTTSSFDVALDFFTKFSVVGLFYSLILSLIFKKKNEANS